MKFFLVVKKTQILSIFVEKRLKFDGLINLLIFLVMKKHQFYRFFFEKMPNFDGLAGPNREFAYYYGLTTILDSSFFSKKVS